MTVTVRDRIAGIEAGLAAAQQAMNQIPDQPPRTWDDVTIAKLRSELDALWSALYVIADEIDRDSV